MKFSTFLSERDKGKLKQFVKDGRMVEAVQKVLLSCAYYEGTIKKDGIPDENFILDVVRRKSTNNEIGAEVKAIYYAIKLLEKGFIELKQFGKEERRDKKKENPAI
jgi:hypothetical protein